jgi:hypothetical protein
LFAAFGKLWAIATNNWHAIFCQFRMLIICDLVSFKFFIFNTLFGVSRRCKSLYLSIALFLGGAIKWAIADLWCSL